MRRIFAVIAVIWLGATQVVRGEDARQPQVDAAVANAVERLYRDVARTPVYSRMTVGELIDKVGGKDDVIKILQGAQEIGGVRWLDDQTAQVRLEISGTRVAQTVLQLAASNPKKTPMSATALASLLSDWDKRTFAAVGTSTGGAAAVDVQPPADDAVWTGVPETARREAISAARADAANRVMEAVRGVELKQGLTVSALMERTGSTLRKDLELYLAARPVTEVRFREDRQVEVAISAPAGEIADMIHAAADATKDAGVVGVDWSRVPDRILSGEGGAIGTAKAAAAPAVVTPVATVKLPDPPPDWIWRQIDAAGTAKGGGSALKCARAAEAAAVEKLRAQIDALSLGDQSVGDARQKDPRLGEAVTRGLARARVYKSDYHADGTVTIYVSLELRDIWDALRQM